MRARDFNRLCFCRSCDATMEITMAGTEIAHRQYRHDGPRYASDLTDGEWALIEPFTPPPLARFIGFVPVASIRLWVRRLVNST